MNGSRLAAFSAWLAPSVLCLLAMAGMAQDTEEYQKIDESDCIGCHEDSAQGTKIAADLSHSIHEGLGCLDCHQGKDTTPHRAEPTFVPGDRGCRGCHEDASTQYQAHGRAGVQSSPDMPKCQDCHGGHDILPSKVRLSRTHPSNLPATCGRCHENLDITKRHDILIDHPIQIYESSVHGKATKGGVYVAATCNDCHSTGSTAHRILSPGHPESAISHFNIPRTCGRCHQGVQADFAEGIHGQLVARGETDAPGDTHVANCASCHGVHRILPSSDPTSTIHPAKLRATCGECHPGISGEMAGMPSTWWPPAAGGTCSATCSRSGATSNSSGRGCSSTSGAARKSPGSVASATWRRPSTGR